MTDIHNKNIVGIRPYYPANTSVRFEFGADDITVIPASGGPIAPENYSLNFSSGQQIDSENYNLNFGSGDEVIIEKVSWDFTAAFGGSNTETSLTIDRLVVENNLHITTAPTGATVVERPVVNKPLTTGTDLIVDDRHGSGPLQFIFDDGVGTFNNPIIPEVIKLGSGVSASVSFEPIAISENPSEGVRSGKNLNYDIPLCPSVSSPDLHSLTQTFQFNEDFLEFDCDQLITLTYHGATLTVGLSVELILGAVDSYHGSYATASVAPTYSLDGDGYHGAYSVLNVFSTYPAATLAGNAYSGAYSNASLYTEMVFSDIDVYTGATLSGVLEVFDPPTLVSTAHHGATLEFEIVESDFNTFAYHGATLEEFALQVEVNLPLEPITHGLFGSTGDLNYAATLEADAYSGANGVISNFTVPVGESIVAVALHGSNSNVNLEAPIHAIFDLIPINASLAMYDGWGGVGGLNHCYTSDDTNVIDLGYDPLGIEDQLIIRFDETGDDPWNVCSCNGAVFTVELQTNKRFNAIAYAGEELEAYIPLETMDLVGVNAQSPILTGETTDLFFEPVEFVRFCKGYIRPNGNSVVFDFHLTEDSGCSMFHANSGEILSTILSVEPAAGTEFFSGEYARATLEVQSLWTALAYGGEVVRAQLYDEAEFVADSRHGSYAQATFYEPPINGSHGATLELDGLVTVGPAIQWVTETQCLPNQYIPMTPGGDLDYSQLEPDENGVVHIVDVPIEYKPYVTTLLAQCITFVQEDD